MTSLMGSPSRVVAFTPLVYPVHPYLVSWDGDDPNTPQPSSNVRSTLFSVILITATKITIMTNNNNACATRLSTQH